MSNSKLSPVQLFYKQLEEQRAEEKRIAEEARQAELLRQAEEQAASTLNAVAGALGINLG